MIHLSFEREYSEYPRERQPVVDEIDHTLHPGDVVARVTPLSPLGARGLDNLFAVQPAKERRLHLEKRGNLPNREDGCKGIIAW